MGAAVEHKYISDVFKEYFVISHSSLSWKKPAQNLPSALTHQKRKSPCFQCVDCALAYLPDHLLSMPSWTIISPHERDGHPLRMNIFRIMRAVYQEAMSAKLVAACNGCQMKVCGHCLPRLASTGGSCVECLWPQLRRYIAYKQNQSQHNPSLTAQSMSRQGGWSLESLF